MCSEKNYSEYSLQDWVLASSVVGKIWIFLYYIINVNPNKVQLWAVKRTREKKIPVTKLLQVLPLFIFISRINKAENLSTYEYENFSSQRPWSTQQYIQMSNVAVILNYIQNCLIKRLNMNQVLYYHWTLKILSFFTMVNDC